MNSGRVSSCCFMSLRLTLDLFNCWAQSLLQVCDEFNQSVFLYTQFNSLLGARVSSVGTVEVIFVLCVCIDWKTKSNIKYLLSPHTSNSYSYYYSHSSSIEGNDWFKARICDARSS
jgi:hypothetical protein